MNRKLISAIVALASMAMTTTAAEYRITDFGAVADTTVLSTHAIQRAIDTCHAHGGGTVSVPAGDYKSSGIELKSDVELHLAPGATIYASLDPMDYAGKAHKSGAADMDHVFTLISARDCHNIAITGLGAIDCRARRTSYQRSPVTSVRDSITGREVYNAALYGADYLTKYRKVPPYTGAINLTGCTNVTLRDISVREANSWSVHIQWCDRVKVNGMYIYSSPENGVNADGLDIDGSTRVSVSDCTIDTGDDGICLKTTYDDTVKHPCRDIAITNCHLHSSSAALKLGTESHFDFENITVSNCTIDGANRGINIILRDGGSARNLIFSNMVISTERKAPFWWGNGDPLWFTVQRRGNIAKAGSIENVLISNIIADGQSGVRMEGFDGAISNIRIRDFLLTIHPENAVDKRARHGFHFDRVYNLHMTDCDMRWDNSSPQPEWGNAYRFDHVDGLRLSNVTGRAANLPVFHYSDITNGSIDGQPIASSTEQ